MLTTMPQCLQHRQSWQFQKKITTELFPKSLSSAVTTKATWLIGLSSGTAMIDGVVNTGATNYNKVIAENTKIGTTLITVTATDHDEGLNGNVRYFIVGGDDNFDFTIDKSSGVIRVQKNLNYERVHTYTLKVQAEDSGSVTRSAYADVTITILDVNDNKPFFVNSPYYPRSLE
jgi:hypothetical protein